MKNKREIIAQQGNDRFLIDLGGDMGQILDVGSKELFPPFYIHSIIAHGYWEDYKGGVDLEIILASGTIYIHKNPEEKLNKFILNIDSHIDNADWTKQTWDLPAYKSKEFMKYLTSTGCTLEQFRRLPVYRYATEKGLIKNDEWNEGGEREMKNAWVIRPYPHGINRIKEFLTKRENQEIGNGIIAIGWPCIQDLSTKNTRENIKEAIKTHYFYSSRSLGQASGCIYRFKQKIKLGDYVLVPDGQFVYIGRVVSDYKYDPTVDSNKEGYPHQRWIEWLYNKKAFTYFLFSFKGNCTINISLVSRRPLFQWPPFPVVSILSNG